VISNVLLNEPLPPNKEDKACITAASINHIANIPIKLPAIPIYAPIVKNLDIPAGKA